MLEKDGIERRVSVKCFAEKTGIIQFNINYDPYTSSIHRKNPEFDNLYFQQVSRDYSNEDARRSVRTSELLATSLDDHAKKLPEAIDFLGIDVEGGEMNVLSGGRQTIGHDVLGVLTEVMFYELLEGQKTFGEVNAFLKSSGYRFV
jgi:FkbM family methyltransferase